MTGGFARFFGCRSRRDLIFQDGSEAWTINAINSGGGTSIALVIVSWNSAKELSAMVTQRQIKDRHDQGQSNHPHDGHMREHVLMLLRESGYWTLSRLECEVTDGRIVLSGTVSSYFLKQVAQSLVLRNIEAKALENRIDVRQKTDE
jgi:hypothetical protein